MSRVANSPVELPSGVQVTIGDSEITVKGKVGSMAMPINPEVSIEQNENVLTFSARSSAKFSRAMSGTTRALVSNMVTGVSQGFEKKLDLVGVGYRAQAQGKKLNLTLGFSHPVEFEIPEGITIDTPTQTEVVVKGADKQLVGQVAANIRAYRKPEPYKGKGVRYADEQVRRKEAKKK